MKKFISMLTMFALASTMFTISAFAEDKPTLNFEVTPYTDYDELVAHNDYLEEAEEIPEGYTAYVIDFYLTNLDLSNSGSQTSPTGTVITDFTLFLKTSSAELNLIDSIVTYANYSADPDSKGTEWNSYYYTATLSRTKGIFPKKTQDAGDVLASTVVMIPSDKSVTLIPMNDVFNNGTVTFTNSVNVATFNGGSLTSGSQVAYKLSTDTLALGGDKIVLGTPAPSEDKTVTAEEDANGVTTIKYGKDYTGSKALEGKKIVVKTLADTDNITKETRFNVTFGDETKPYGGTLWDHLGLEGKGALAVNKLTIAIAFDADVENVTAANVSVALVK